MEHSEQSGELCGWAVVYDEVQRGFSFNSARALCAVSRNLEALLLRRRESEVSSLKQQIEVLNDLGLKPIEIAEILGRSNIYINKELLWAKESTKEKGVKDEEWKDAKGKDNRRLVAGYSNRATRACGA